MPKIPEQPICSSPAAALQITLSTTAKTCGPQGWIKGNCNPTSQRGIVVTRELRRLGVAGGAGAALIASLTFALCSTFAESRSTALQKNEAVKQEVIAREKASFVAWQKK